VWRYVWTVLPILPLCVGLSAVQSNVSDKYYLRYVLVFAWYWHW